MWIDLVVFELEAIAELKDKVVCEVFGTSAALRSLKAAEIAVGVVTGLPRHVAHHAMRALGWMEVVDVCVTASDGVRPAPHPDMVERAMRAVGVWSPARVASVSSSPLGLLQGATAGASVVIAVDGRAFEPLVLRGAPCTQTVPTPALVPEVLRRIQRRPAGAAACGASRA
jgi:beta-phosphoglucomutase-like phosphatase (HAD superfamily)